MITLHNGARVVSIAGKPDTGIVLANWDGEYVVWRYEKNERGEYHCEHGNYFSDKVNGMEKAFRGFRDRVAAFFGWEAPVTHWYEEQLLP